MKAFGAELCITQMVDAYRALRKAQQAYTALFSTLMREGAPPEVIEFVATARTTLYADSIGEVEGGDIRHFMRPELLQTLAGAVEE